MGHRPNLMGEPGEEPPGLAGPLQEAAPHPRHRLLILPAAQQFRLGVAFSSLVSMVAAHTVRIHSHGMHCNHLLTCASVRRCNWQLADISPGGQMYFPPRARHLLQTVAA